MIPGMDRREFLAAVAAAILVPRKILIHDDREPEPDFITYWLLIFDRSCEMELTEDALEAAHGLTDAIRDAGMPEEWQPVHRGASSFLRMFSGASQTAVPHLWDAYKSRRRTMDHSE
jgi:hypothetical protein